MQLRTLQHSDSLKNDTLSLPPFRESNRLHSVGRNRKAKSSADTIAADTIELSKAQRRINRQIAYASFLPDPQKSLWYALAFPGLGQIYNRKYWKLPIVYGGALGVAYAISLNGSKYSDYKRAYIEATDNNPNTNYHLQVIPTGYPESSAETYVKNRMNTYRNYRDISIVVGVAFYAITIIDAYVDAQLAGFDISPDLTMKVKPSLTPQPDTPQPAVGCGVQLTF